MGGAYGIWEELQDSLGNYLLKENGNIMDYREFCEEIFDETDYLWFLRLIDFYGDIHIKASAEIHEMVESLQTLDAFLKQTSASPGPADRHLTKQGFAAADRGNSRMTG